MGGRIVTLLALLVACKAKPDFVLPSYETGGFAVQCVSVTDFAKRLTPCDPNLLATNGGCACAQPGRPLGKPPLDSVLTLYQLGVISFDDPFCETDTPLTCVPMVIPTDSQFRDPKLEANGKLETFYLVQVPERGNRINQLLNLDIKNYSEDPNLDLDVAKGVARDFQNEVQNDCKLAHYSMLVQQIYGYPKGSPQWATQLLLTASEYDAYTSGLNADHLAPRRPPEGGTARQFWGDLTSDSTFFDIAYQPYATAQWYGGTPATMVFGRSSLFACNAGMQLSGTRGDTWGVAALNDFNSPSPVSHPPPPQGTPRIAQHQSVKLSAGSSGLLSISGVDETASLDLSGGVEVSIGNCSAVGCAASLESLTLRTAPFSFRGYDVATITVSQVFASGGTLKGNTLAFTSLTGSVRITLTDGRYADTPIGSGAILANWNVSTRNVTMAFAFDTTLSDGTDVTINGSAFATFDNTAPTAAIAVASPATPIANGQANVECQSPSGTSVTLDGSQSSDRESGPPQLGWWVDDLNPVARRGAASQLVVSDLALGSHTDVALMAYDQRGFAGEDRLKMTVVDTLPTQISAPDVCVFPPNKKEFCVRLGHELQVTAVDQCDGDVSSSVQITSVTSSTGSGVVSFDGEKACLIADRSGADGATIYSIDVSAADQSGNVATHTIAVTIPHNGPTKNCLRQPQIASEVK